MKTEEIRLMANGQAVRLFFGACLPVNTLAEVLCIKSVQASTCPFCKHPLREKPMFCSHCGTKLNGTICEATDMDVFLVLSNLLGRPPAQVSLFLYNGYVCAGYELATSGKGIAIYDSMPQYKPWKEMMDLLYKYLNKDPLSSKSHLIKASFFALGG